MKDKVETEEDVSNLQENLDKIYKWEAKNNIKFNGDKFLVIRYGRNQDIKEDTCYFTGDIEHIIEEVESCRDLGVTMENSAKFELHIEKFYKKVRQKCG